MPYDVEWDADRQLLVCRLSGSLEGADLGAMIGDARATGPSDGELNICVDARSITQLGVDFSDKADLLARMNRFEAQYPRGRTAIVTARSIDQALAKLLALTSYTGMRERKQFDELDEAMAWLGQTKNAID